MGDYIRQEELIVTCNIPINQVQHLSIQESMGAHTSAKITANIERGSLDISGSQLHSEPLMIYAVSDQGQSLLFSGVVGKVCVEQESSYDVIHLWAYSLSWFMDLERKNRSFQDSNHSIVELIHSIADEQSVSILCSAADQTIQKPLIQYQETDWEFLLRLSTHLYVPAFVACDYEGKGIYLGFQEDRPPLELQITKEVWRMDAKPGGGQGWKTRDAAYYEVITGQVYHLGEHIIHRNEDLWIHKGSMVLQQGILQCTYLLAGKHYHSVSVTYNPRMKGISLTGTVLERKEEAIKVHLDLDEEQDAATAYSYPWFPEHGNMMYCMPETGSKIRLLIPGEDEREAFGIHCIRQNGGVCEETGLPSNRWFTTKDKKTISLKPASLELSGDGKRSTITIQDNVGHVIRSSGKILIQAKGKVSLQGAKVEITAPKEITAVKRQLGSPTVVNVCHNLDSMGKYTTFKNPEELKSAPLSGGSSYGEGQIVSDKRVQEMSEEEREKMQFKRKELMEEYDKRSTYEFGASIVTILSSIPQSIKQDKLSQIAVGFRPIAGTMKGE